MLQCYLLSHQAFFLSDACISQLLQLSSLSFSLWYCAAGEDSLHHSPQSLPLLFLVYASLSSPLTIPLLLPPSLATSFFTSPSLPLFPPSLILPQLPFLSYLFSHIYSPPTLSLITSFILLYFSNPPIGVVFPYLTHSISSFSFFTPLWSSSLLSPSVLSNSATLTLSSLLFLLSPSLVSCPVKWAVKATDDWRSRWMGPCSLAVAQIVCVYESVWLTWWLLALTEQSKYENIASATADD